MKRTLLAAALALVGAASPAPAAAQSYPIDCAILLCLAGGWPASVPCARARAEFIRRITPWPVEPPLQIWNCPMHAAYRIGPGGLPAVRLYDAALPLQPVAGDSEGTAMMSPLRAPENPEPTQAALRRPKGYRPSREAVLQLAQAVGSGADIDISSSEFDFVRSIKVWQVEYRHHQNRNGDCVESDWAQLGSYGTQGDYRWTRSSAHAAPAWMGINIACTNRVGMYRGVGVEWVDYQGTAGHELVRY